MYLVGKLPCFEIHDFYDGVWHWQQECLVAGTAGWNALLALLGANDGEGHAVDAGFLLGWPPGVGADEVEIEEI